MPFWHFAPRFSATWSSRCYCLTIVCKSKSRHVRYSCKSYLLTNQKGVPWTSCPPGLHYRRVVNEEKYKPWLLQMLYTYVVFVVHWFRCWHPRRYLLACTIHLMPKQQFHQTLFLLCQWKCRTSWHYVYPDRSVQSVRHFTTLVRTVIHQYRVSSRRSNFHTLTSTTIGSLILLIMIVLGTCAWPPAPTTRGTHTLTQASQIDRHVAHCPLFRLQLWSGVDSSSLSWPVLADRSEIIASFHTIHTHSCMGQ